MIKSVRNLRSYGVPWRGNPMLHEELAFYATENDLVLGVVIRDRVDNDFSWVVMAHKSIATPQFDNEVTASGYSLFNMAASRLTQGVATKELHAAMEKVNAV